MTQIIYPELSYDLQGALFEVHNSLRHFGLSESGWEKALAIALNERGIVARCQVEFALFYKGRRVGRFFVDVIAEREEQILLELKKTALEAVHKAKVIAYLRVTDIKLGLLVTFGGERVEFQRIPNRVSERIIPEANPTPPSTLQALDPYLAQMLWSAFCEVHRELGPGFLHMHYRRACQVELRLNQAPFKKINEIAVQFRGQPIERRKVSLLLVNSHLLVAPLAVRWITPEIVGRHRHYLKLLGVNQGLIINFRPKELETVLVSP